MSSLFIGIPFWFIPLLILIVSILSLTIILERAWSLVHRIKPIKKEDQDQLIGYIKKKDFNNAISFCRLQQHPAYKVAVAIIEEAGRSKETYDLKNISDEASLEQLRDIERYLPSLGTISTVSPLLGLLGTVTGMIKSFSAFENAASQSSQLFGGIDEALVTTAFGLIVAIPSLVMYNSFVKRVGSLVNDINLLSEIIIKILNRSTNRK